MEKTFVTKSNLDKVCFYLIIRGKEFSHIPGKGVTFQADDEFVEAMKNNLVSNFGCSLKPVVNEVKGVNCEEVSKSRQLEEALSPHTPENGCICQGLERHRQNLLSLLCRVLRAAPEYKLRPSELAVENVGDLSSLSQETRGYLYMRMVPERPSRTATSDISQARPCSRCPYVSGEAVK